MSWATVRRLSVWALLALLAVTVVGALTWRIDGGRWYVVETPSMGTRAPVGTLLWVKPTEFDTLEEGDFISFHPPGKPDLTYSHLVRGVTPNGLTTGGKISGNDPWLLTSKDVVGSVRGTWYGIGWLVRAAPFLIAGGVLVALVRSRFRPDRRLPIGIVGTGLVLTLAIIVLQPLTRVEQLSFTPIDGGARARYVTTGLLPMRLSTWDDRQSAVMRPGEVGTVDVTHTDDKGRYRIEIRPHVPWWFWALVITGSFLPALATLRRAEPLPDADLETEPSRDWDPVEL